MSSTLPIHAVQDSGTSLKVDGMRRIPGRHAPDSVADIPRNPGRHPPDSVVGIDRITHIELDEFVCMPNHMHGIIVLPDSYKSEINLKNNQNDNETRFEKFGAPVKGSIPTIIRSYKSAVTQRVQWIMHANKGPVWQPGFYEHVIRTELELNRIRQYILDNPIKWALDEENPDRKML
jgi:REP element-mobilizing transposase RayT